MTGRKNKEANNDPHGGKKKVPGCNERELISSSPLSRDFSMAPRNLGDARAMQQAAKTSRRSCTRDLCRLSSAYERLVCGTKMFLRQVGVAHSITVAYQ